jgi:hypothetical protein
MPVATPKIKLVERERHAEATHKGLIRSLRAGLRRVQWLFTLSVSYKIVLFAFSLFALLACLDANHHRRFRSGVVGNASMPGVVFQVEGIEFEKDKTIVSLVVMDMSPTPQFAGFRNNIPKRVTDVLIRVPALYGLPSGTLDASGPAEMSDVLLIPKPNNEIREGRAQFVLEALSRVRPDEFTVDRLYLKIPTAQPIEVSRVAPLSQGEGAINVLHNGVIKTLTPRRSAILTWLVLIALVVEGHFIYRDTNVLVHCQRIVAGETMKKPDSNDGNQRDGKSMLPPRWDEKSITLEFTNLRNRPGLLKFYVQAVIDRFVIGQNDNTVKVRIDYLKSKLEELNISVQIQETLDALQFRETDLEIKRLQKEVEKNDLVHRKEHMDALRDVEHKRDLLKAKAEAAQFEKQIRETRQRPERSATKEAKASEVRGRIQRFREKKVYVQQTVTDADERRREENRIDDKLAELQDELDALE